MGPQAQFSGDATKPNLRQIESAGTNFHVVTAVHCFFYPLFSQEENAHKRTNQNVTGSGGELPASIVLTQLI